MGWICDGVPKNGQTYSSSGAHAPFDNSTSICSYCGLPEEAMKAGKGKKTLPLNKTAILVGGALALLLGGAGFAANRFLSEDTSKPSQPTTSSPTPSPAAGLFVSSSATNARIISQGEKILLPAAKASQTPLKEAGAAAFSQQKWDEAIAQYQQAVDADQNEPESKIYLNNARAKLAGKSILMAVVVPITASSDSAQEILRGVAQYQDEYNKTPGNSGKLLEIAIVNDERPGVAPTIAQDLINYPGVYGVLGHGVDQGSRDAIALYEKSQLAVVSPVNTNLTTAAGQSNLQTIPLAQQASQLLATYLQKVGEALVSHAQKTSPSVKAVIFYNSDSLYSQQLKDSLFAALTKGGGTAIQQVDVSTSPSFDAKAAIASANQIGANTALLALSKSRVNDAIALATANAATTQPIALMGGDELYNPTLLLTGGDAIEGMVLAVPWSSQPNDPFAAQAASIWKGRVSWRTATAYDAASALAQVMAQSSDRASVAQALNKGTVMPKATTSFSLFNEIPLVQAVQGSNGPKGSRYQFDPLPNQ
jgi:branched-chain amino acid transport system substrate-binding protein